MTRQELTAALKQAIVKELNLEDVTPESIRDDAILFGEEGLGLDSLDAVELVVMVEKRFGVAIADAEEAREAFRSVAVLAEFIVSRTAAGA